MPNHVINHLSISAPSKERYWEVREAIKGDNGEPIDFDKILPMPNELNLQAGQLSHVAEAVRIFNDKKELSKWQQELVAEYLSMDDEKKSEVDKYISNYKQFGAYSWYGWRINNWGTKWNAYQCSEDFKVIEGEDFSFCTAWTTCHPLFIALSRKFPDCTFSNEFADEDLGSGNCGRYEYDDGVATEYAIENVESFARQMWDLNESYDEED